MRYLVVGSPPSWDRKSMGWNSRILITPRIFIEMELNDIKSIETKIESSCKYGIKIWRWMNVDGEWICVSLHWEKLKMRNNQEYWTRVLCIIPSIFLGVVTRPFRFRAFGPWLVKMHLTSYDFLFNRTLFHGSGVTILRNTALFCSFSIYRVLDERWWHWNRNKNMKMLLKNQLLVGNGKTKKAELEKQMIQNDISRVEGTEATLCLLFAWCTWWTVTFKCFTYFFRLVRFFASFLGQGDLLPQFVSGRLSW